VSKKPEESIQEETTKTMEIAGTMETMEAQKEANDRI